MSNGNISTVIEVYENTNDLIEELTKDSMKNNKDCGVDCDNYCNDCPYKTEEIKNN